MNVDQLKSTGHYFAAGALAYALNQGRNYGCHFGMRSELENARATFIAGYEAAERNAK